MSASYKFRAADRCNAMRFLSWATALLVLPARIDLGMVSRSDLPDVEVTFTAAEVRVDLLQKVARSLGQCEVIAKTLAPVEQYTGLQGGAT